MAETVLLLNATYEPLCVVPLRRAVVLVLAEKAEVVVPDAERFVRSARLSLPEPSVIRLLRVVRVPYLRRSSVTRRAVLRRDGHRCAYCGGGADTVDHVVPRSRGGRHSWENVVAACRRCNSRKGDRMLSELGWRLRDTPAAPTGTRCLVVALARVEPTWEPWLAHGPSTAPAFAAAG